MNPHVPAAGLCWLLALMPDFHCSLNTALHLMPWDCLNTDSWLILGIMEGRMEEGSEHTSLYNLKIQDLMFIVRHVKF